MMKFFRLYQNYILAIGGAALMVIFLIEPAFQKLSGPSDNPVIGTVDGQSIRRADEIAAEYDLRALNQLSPLMGALAPQDATGWALALFDAQRMGLSASEAEIDQAQEAVGITTPEALADRGRVLGYQPQTLRRALRDWLVLMRYRELVQGVGHVKLSDRVGYLGLAGNMYQANNRQAAMLMLDVAGGAPLLSTPVLERFLYDLSARAKITAVSLSLSANALIDPKSAPDEALIKELFEQYKDALPGEGRPYGLGYRTPDRLKLEYLSLPQARVAASVQIDEADALAYYEAHPEEFRPKPPAGAQTQPFAFKAAAKPYSQVRDELVKKLQDEKAQELTDRIIRAAQTMLNEQLTGLTEADGYRRLSDDFKPLTLAEVAKHVQEKFGVLPDVVREDRWLSGADLAAIQNLTFLQVRTPMGDLPLVPYLFSAREFKPDAATNPAASLHLQVGVPTLPAFNLFGDRTLVRLTAAQPSASPASLDEVRDRVVTDARRVAAFRKLVAQKGQWTTVMHGKSMEDLAKAQSASVLKPDAFSRRTLGRTRVLEAPRIEGLGADEKFVDGVFGLAEGIAKSGLAIVPEDARRAAIPMEQTMTLYLVRLEDYTPITLSEFNQRSVSPGLASGIYQSLLAMSGTKAPNVFSTEAIKLRLGYTERKN
ncbi:MAG: SurA N-terminal domain-containing protein [Planctomycetes bacterium]|nr:SurA N-terminal domain-containing protein [Planctomycetota bacterium]